MNDQYDFRECLDCHGAAARRRAAELTRLYDAQLRAHGLSIAQFTLLVTLIVGGATTIQELANRMGIDRTTLSRNLEVAEQRGMVKVTVGKDQRQREVKITPDGRHLAEAALPSWRLAQAAAEKG